MRYQQIWMFFTALILTLILSGNLQVQAAEEKSSGESPSVMEIVEKASFKSYYQGRDGRAQVKMTIVSGDGQERIREFVILRRDEPQKAMENVDQKFYVYFYRPADVREMVFMVWKHVAKGQNDDRWLYLPALDLVKRIAATDERTSFVGSHFFYEDISGRNINEDTHQLVETTDTYYVVDSKPNDPDMVEFSHYKTWIHRDTFIPVQAVYFDKNQEKYRQYKVLEVQTIQGFKTITQSEMKNLRTGGYTRVQYQNVAYDVGLPEDIFTERYLRKPPVKYLR